MKLLHALGVGWKKVKVARSCLPLCDPTDYTVRGVLQARILEWVAFPFSRGSSQPRDQTQISLYQLSYQGSPGILEWVAYPFSSRSSLPRNWNRVSCIAGGFFIPAEPQGKPQNPGVGSLSLLQAPFQPRDQTQVSHIAGRFFTSWATTDAPVGGGILHK